MHLGAQLKLGMAREREEGIPERGGKRTETSEGVVLYLLTRKEASEHQGQNRVSMLLTFPLHRTLPASSRASLACNRILMVYRSPV